MSVHLALPLITTHIQWQTCNQQCETTAIFTSPIPILACSLCSLACAAAMAGRFRALSEAEEDVLSDLDRRNARFFGRTAYAEVNSESMHARACMWFAGRGVHATRVPWMGAASGGQRRNGRPCGHLASASHLGICRVEWCMSSCVVV